ncbi:hypothetical protein GCM10010435_33240 [Winogradskya consettensis]|uniref:Uncharacterized protein n=1 Tax=Winogradskya consettensis TaxID=113560 RepID=A0A919SFF8_9ACTN|nr:hypothetical protein [Actinoplanes consettensis]GIM70058.1 hypothetical protein Aco04nite_18250 [Actinoplanes consettensis]
MGSDWTWELHIPVTAEHALRDLHPHRPDGLTNLFGLADPGPRTVGDPRIAVAAMATGRVYGQFWTPDEVDIFVTWTDGVLLDEWSTEQIWHLGIHDAAQPAGPWTAELGWLTYLGPGHPSPPLVDTRSLPNGGVLITLLEDPAAVDPVRYQGIQARWWESEGQGRTTQRRQRAS